MVALALIDLLRRHVPANGVRPFVCTGDPSGISAFIVGHNPRNRKAEFWKYWSNETGFDKRQFEADYRALKGGFRGARLRLKRISDALERDSIRVLETNLYWEPSDWSHELNEKKIEPFVELLALIKPRVVIAHGRAACDEIENALRRAGASPVIDKREHFMRMSYDQADAVTRLIRDVDKGLTKGSGQ
jgi:hypothetical protein